MADDFVLSVRTLEVTDETVVRSIKRELYNMVPWLSDYCKDRDLLKREFLHRETIELIKYFIEVLKDEGRDIHEFAGVKLEQADEYNVRIRFLGYRNE